MTRCKPDGGLYFGPFTSEGSVDGTLDFIKDHYPVRRCGRGHLPKDSAGCLNFQLKACLGPCTNAVKEEYGKCIGDIIKFLDGKDYGPVRELHSRMKAAAGELDFEKAALYRDQLRAIRHVLNKQRLVKVSRYGRNIVAVQKIEESKVKIFLIKGNRLLHGEALDLSDYDAPGLEDKLKVLIGGCFKDKKEQVEKVLSQDEIDEAQIIYSYLKKRSNGIRSFHIPISRVDRVNTAKIAEMLFQQ